MKIFQAGIGSTEVIIPLFNAYRMFYEQESQMEGAREFIQERLENQESVIFLAMEEEEAVGFTQLYPTFSSVGMNKGYILNDLYVDSNHRKRGIGKALIEKVFEFCEEKNAKFVSLETAQDNHAAKGLYEQLGMKQVNLYDCYVKTF